MSYAFLSYLQARQALAQRLYDTGTLFFTDAELKVYVLEALQTFNALARFYRQEFVFNTRQNVTWYDLGDTVNLPNTLIPRTLTDLALLNTIEYHLLEPQTATYPLTWTGSKQFVVTDILNAIQQVRDQLLSETNCTITQSLVNAAFTARTTLNDKVMDIRRVAWIPATGFGYTPNLLMPSDIWAQQAFEVGFPQLVQASPISYRRGTTPPLSFDVDRIPPVVGNYDLLTINADGTLVTTQSMILPLPNDWAWAVKWGALAQLLNRESAATDPVRGQYAAERYTQAVAVMQTIPALLAARINDVPVVVEAISSGDFYAANWQGLAVDTPSSIYYAGLNMIALAPAPSAGPFSLTVNVVRNMVLPSLDTDQLQVGRDDVATILDYAQHIAMFKVGGAEFIATFPLYRNFIRHCAVYNSKLSARSPYREFIEGRGKEDERLHPVLDPGTVNRG